MMTPRSFWPHPFAFFTAMLGVPLLLAGCAAVGGDVTGSINQPLAPLPHGADAVRAYTTSWGDRYQAQHDNINAAMNYARGLRREHRNNQAAAVLEVAVLHHPKDRALRAEYGKALVDAGHFSQALPVLQAASTPDHPDWSVLSAEGTIADQIGDHVKAQSLYASALKIRPGEPSVLSNLGLSYALSRNLPAAEQVLAQAAASPQAGERVQQNYALVLALEGKFQQSEQVSARNLPPAEAAANVAAIRQMIAQSDTWKSIQQSAPKAPSRRHHAKS